MRSALLRRVTFALGIVIVATMVAYLVTQRDLLESLRAVSAIALVAVIGTCLMLELINGIQFHRVCRAFDVHPTYIEAFGLAITGTMLNLVTPLKGGMIMRAAYMKQRFGLPYARYGALLASSQLILVIAAASVGLMATGLAFAFDGVAPLGLTLALSMSMIGSVLAYWFIHSTDFSRVRPPALGRQIARFAEGFGAWRRHPRVLWAFSSTVVLSIVVLALRLYLVFRALDVAVAPMPLLMITAIVAISGAVPLTPGNLGIREGITAVSAGLLGIDPRVALLASLVDRAAGLVVTVGLGLVFSHTLLRGWSETASADLAPPSLQEGLDPDVS